LNTRAKFERFLSNIQLTSLQLQDAQTKHTGVRKALHAHYYGTPYSSSTSILVGSYGKNTAVRPPTDVDILFIMPIHLFNGYHTSFWNGQSQLLQDVKNVLLKTYSRTDISGDGQVVVVSFVNSFGVEIVPVFHSGGSAGVFLTPDTHSGGSWKVTNPDAEKRHISASNTNSKGNTVHLVKMLKVWKRYCSVPISSLGLELLAVPFINQWRYRGNSPLYYDLMMRDFFEYMLTRQKSGEFIPGISEYYEFGDAWESRAQTALGRAKKACEYEPKDDLVSDLLANVEWKKIFGDFFTG
jgi:hypothetical protein